MGPDFRHGDALTFHMVNRNKQSIALDLKSTAGKADFERLAASADILIHNLRSGAAEGLGIDGPALTTRHPRLIYCAISAFGHLGPMRDRPGYEPLIQAYSGLSSTNGGPDDPPMRLGVAVCDLGTGMWIIIGALAALHRRQSHRPRLHHHRVIAGNCFVWAAQRGDAWINGGSMPASTAPVILTWRHMRRLMPPTAHSSSAAAMTAFSPNSPVNWAAPNGARTAASPPTVPASTTGPRLRS